MLLTFRRLKAERADQPVVIFDIARFPNGASWAYVADGVNRSGTNPLRGLGTLMRQPFVDVSRLYHLPEGCEGVELVALGSRYPGGEALLAGLRPGRALGGYLHAAAILAHTEGLRVTGVLVVESHAAHFDLRPVAAG